MVMNAMRQGAKSGVSKIFLFGFMVMAVGGLVLMDVKGMFQSGAALTPFVAGAQHDNLLERCFHAGTIQVRWYRVVNGGATFKVNDHLSAFGSVSYSFDVDGADHNAIGGEIGLKMRW